MGLIRAEMARMTSEVEGGDAQPGSAAGPPAGVRTAAPFFRDVNALGGKWPAAGLAEKKGASSRREVPAPTSFFGSVQRVLGGWKRKCKLRSTVV